MPSIICMHQLTYLEIFHDRVVIPHLLVDPAQVELRLDLDVVGVAKGGCLLYTSPSPRDRQKSRMPSSA